jgi:arsenite methyltransferase
MAEQGRNGSPKQVREAVRDRYGAIARMVLEQKQAGSDGPGSGCCGDRSSGIGAANYDTSLVGELPQDAIRASLGCGNPMALAELRPGEVVLDLGSGGGIDVLLSAQRIGPSGAAFGLDMTNEMLQLAERNRVAAGVENARFLKGQMEEIPLPDASVDVVISNCVINLAADKDRVLGEAFRVLRPGGRFAVSDIVVDGQLPASTRRDLATWSACIAGVLSEQEYRTKLAAAGFTGIDIETLHTHALADLQGSACCSGVGSLPGQREGDSSRLTSAFVRARKPVPPGSDHRTTPAESGSTSDNLASRQ